MIFIYTLSSFLSSNLIMILSSLLFLLSFSFSSTQDSTLVQIGDRIITKNDFIKRAEYTIRPPYCKGDNIIHKKIILNSLIAEKILAIDIEQNLLKDYSTPFLEGLKEQKMRELLLAEEIYDNIIIDSTEIKNHLYNVNKKYHIQFLSVNNDSVSMMVENLIKQSIDFKDICHNYIKIDKIPKRTISYNEEYDPSIHSAIFSTINKKNDVIGPVYTKDKKVLFIHIIGWEDSPIVTQSDYRNQIQLVREKIYEMQSIRLYDQYIQELMSGLHINFHREPFITIAENTFKEFKTKTNQIKSNDVANLDLNNEQYNLDPNKPLLDFTGDSYTINEVNTLIQKHPLVFRKEIINKDEYPDQLKYAFADLIRDEQLNIMAYAKNYDKHPDLIKDLEMFRDAALSNLHILTYLQGKDISIEKFNEDYINIIKNHLNTYVQSMNQKYSSTISINFNLFDKIKLTNIDLYAYKKGLPYSYTVPNFPIITTNHEISYGKDLNLP